MALEQLPVVCFGGGRSGADQRMGHSEDEDAKTGGVEPTVSAVVVPMSRKARDMGHPRLEGAIGRQHASGRPGPPARTFAYKYTTDRVTDGRNRCGGESRLYGVVAFSSSALT